ncbi:hypothetical protein F4679DRAFT_561086 [Xylaria curta]|nr:hypothetical protein F4679DRAFT_561086 [Xylaria curta]
MGVAISTVRNEARKQTEDTEKLANDALSSLVDLAKLEMELFKSRVKDQSDSTMIKVSKFIQEDTVIKCTVEFEAKKIADHLVKVYKAFANGEVAEAIGEVLSGALEGLFDQATASSNETTKYFVTVGKLGYPYRVDLHLYSYEFKCAALTGLAKNVLAVSVIISSVDLSDLTETDIGAIVQVCYQGAEDKTLEEIEAKLVNIRDKQRNEKNSKTGSGTEGKFKSGRQNASKATSSYMGRNERTGLEFPSEENSDSLLDFDTIAMKSQLAWKEAMQSEGVIPPYQPPKPDEKLLSLLSKLL